LTVCPSPFPFAPDRTYASKYIPIIASVSEHQPPTWPSYFMDINVLAFLVPAGIENAIKLKYAEKKIIFFLWKIGLPSVIPKNTRQTIMVC